MKIGVCGVGKLGLPLAVLLAKHFKVYGVDVNEKRIAQIRKPKDFFEPQVNKYLEDSGSNLVVSADYTILGECSVVFVIVQTPSLPSGEFDLRYVESALKALHDVNPDCLAVVSSTINIGDMERLRMMHRRVCYNPEFIKRGSIIHDFENPKFVLIGSDDKGDADITTSIWKTVHNNPIHVVKPVEAEIIKLSLNIQCTLGIAFANMVGEVCETFHADPATVLDSLYKDRRDYKTGLGFGGVCFPRDVECFKVICSNANVRSGEMFASLLGELNEATIRRYTQRIRSFGKKKIGFLGVAYKPNVPYVTESQSLKIAQNLVDAGYEVYVFDKLAEENAKQVLRGEVFFCDTKEECLRKADVIFIGTSNYRDTAHPTVVNPWG